MINPLSVFLATEWNGDSVNRTSCTQTSKLSKKATVSEKNDYVLCEADNIILDKRGNLCTSEVFWKLKRNVLNLKSKRT